MEERPWYCSRLVDSQNIQFKCIFPLQFSVSLGHNLPPSDWESQGGAAIKTKAKKIVVVLFLNRVFNCSFSKLFSGKLP